MAVSVICGHTGRSHAYHPSVVCRRARRKLDLVVAQQPPGSRRRAAGSAAAADVVLRHQRGLGNGANLGGIAGADRICQTLAAAAGGGGKTWHAYLSARGRGGQPAVNARDRIGAGLVQRQGRAHRPERRRPARRHARAGPARQQPDEGDGAEREG
jgi:hypothetical protein